MVRMRLWERKPRRRGTERVQNASSEPSSHPRASLMYKLLRSKDLRRSVVIASHAGAGATDVAIPASVLSEHYSNLSSRGEPLPHRLRVKRRQSMRPSSLGTQPTMSTMEVRHSHSHNPLSPSAHPLARCEQAFASLGVERAARSRSGTPEPTQPTVCGDVSGADAAATMVSAERARVVAAM
eukprot:m.39202 g.39202  ORF g.39202 m.39202 type:complete len:182 (+) comp5766_c0_seq1:246-791(+)